MRLELVRADRGHQQDAFVAQVADEEGEQVPRRRIGPLEILDDEHGRHVPGEPVDHTQDELEQAHLGESVVAAGLPAGPDAAGIGRRRWAGPGAQLGHQPGELAAVGTEQRRQRTRIELPEQVAEGLDEWGIRQAACPERQASTGQDPAAHRLDAIGERANETRLADPGLTGHDHRPRLAGGGPRKGRSEPVELRRPRDERLAARGIHDPAMIGAPTAPTRCLGAATVATPTLGHNPTPATSSRDRSRLRARHSWVRVAGPDLPMIPAISSGR